MLLNTCFPRALHIDDLYLDWLYNQNPDGQAIAANCFEGGSLVAHMAGIPMRALVDGREERGLLCVHAASLGRRTLAGALVRALDQIVDSAVETNFNFLYGSVNQMSARVLSRRQDVQNVCALDARLGIGPPPRVASASIPSQVESVWNRERLRWRFSRPDAHYRLCVSGDRAVVFGDVGIGAIGAELASFSERMIPSGVIPHPISKIIRLWIGLDHRRDWTLAPYLNLPQRLRPVPLQLMHLDLSGTNRRFEPGRLVFQAIDFDLY
jgi:hypothetical protein